MTPPTRMSKKQKEMLAKLATSYLPVVGMTRQDTQAAEALVRKGHIVKDADGNYRLADSVPSSAPSLTLRQSQLHSMLKQRGAIFGFNFKSQDVRALNCLVRKGYAVEKYGRYYPS